jgi:asparagine synthase (glutamine-hydrolysing)
MCGIFGTIGTGIQSDAVLRASALIRHRGPDDEGFLLASPDRLRTFGGPDTPADVLADEGPSAPDEVLAPGQSFDDAFLLLGFRRLAIVDLSPAGHQPMLYANRYWMVFNGEVYNYRELRIELEALGDRFLSDSDSEVILAAYARWGAACLSRFNGMWGLAIYDRQEQTLFLARDRFGVKPLYLWNTGQALHFASEIKAFTAACDWRPRARMERVLEFLAWNVTDQNNSTFFADVTQLGAGHYCLLDLSGLADGGGLASVTGMEPIRWYEPRPGPAITGKAAVQAVRDDLEDAVRLRLRADVVVGSCLSGGLDSSAIVCLMSRQLQAGNASAAVKTITARSLDAEFDEGRYARAVIEQTRALATEVTPRPEGLFEDLDRLVWHQDEPFLTTSIYAQWTVFRAAAEQGLTVMLDGQGADEVFGGYQGFFGAALAGHVRKGAVVAWLADVKALKRVVGFSPVRSVGYTLAYLFPGAARLLGKFDNRAFSDTGWIAEGRRSTLRDDPSERYGARATSVTAMSLAQVRATNLPMLLHWEDRNSMAHSIEARVPFLDYRVVETALGLPDAEKVSRGVTKRAVRRAMEGIVPSLVLDRRDKMGFLTAEPLWIRRDMASTFRAEIVSAIERLPSILAPRLLEQFDEVVAGKRPFDFRYWRAIVLARWAKVFAVEFDQ